MNPRSFTPLLDPALVEALHGLVERRL